MGSHLALFLFLSLSSTSFAGITIATTGSNASNVVASPAAGAGPNFYYSNISGSTDGVNWLAGTGANNSCATSGGLTVNPNCRDSTSPFTLTASDTVPTSGNSTMTIFYLAAGAVQPAPSPTTSIAGLGTYITSFRYTANSVAGPSNFSFGTICGVLAAAGLAINSACVPNDPTTLFTVQLYIVADANGDTIFESGESILPFNFSVLSQIPINSSIPNQIGLYGFQTFPGDGEVYLKPEQIAEGTGTNGAYAVNFYYVTSPNNVYDPNFNTSAPGIFAQINQELHEPAATTAFQQIILNSDGTLPTNYITGLSNGTNYYFRASLVDAAGNIGYMTPATDDLPASPPLPFQWHAARPDQIAGLLSKNGECFIATAAYGTPMAKQVQILREFRDKILMKSQSGQKFIYWYYKNGNALAGKIRDRDEIRAVVRALLYPIIGYGWLALKIGAFNAALLISTILMLPLLLIQLRRSRKILEDIS